MNADRAELEPKGIIRVPPRQSAVKVVVFLLHRRSLLFSALKQFSRGRSTSIRNDVPAIILRRRKPHAEFAQGVLNAYISWPGRRCLGVVQQIAENKRSAEGG